MLSPSLTLACFRSSQDNPALQQQQEQQQQEQQQQQQQQPQRRRRQLSEEHRQKIAAAMRRRWQERAESAGSDGLRTRRARCMLILLAYACARV